MSHDSANAAMRSHAIWLLLDKASKLIDGVKGDVTSEEANALALARASLEGVSARYKIDIDAQKAPAP